MQIPISYIYLAGEALALLLLVVCLLVYFYFRDISQWRQVVERIKKRLNKLRRLYDEEKSRADIVRDNLTKAQKKIIELQAKIDTFEVTTGEFQDEITLLNEQLAGQKERYKTTKAEMEQQALEIPPLKEEIKEKEREILRQQIYIDELEGDTSPNRTSAEFGNEDSAIPTNNTTIGIVENEGTELEGWTQQSSLELDRLQNKNSEQRRVIQDLELQLDNIEQAASPDGGAESDLQKRQLSEAETCINILEAELDTATQRINELEEQLEQGGSTGSGSESQVSQLTQKLSESETCISILETELDTMTEKIHLLEAELEKSSKNRPDDGEVSSGMSI